MTKWTKNYVSVKKKAPKINPDPPIFDLEVRNPITYIRNWWKKIIGNEGVEIKVKVRPITTLLIVALVLTGTYGLGVITAFLAKVPYIKDVLPTPAPVVTPTPTTSPWKETAFSGTLRYSSVTSKYYLTTTSAEAITLEVPPSVDVARLVGKRIFAAGNNNKLTDFLIVSKLSGIVILPPSPQPIPTVFPSPSPSDSPIPGQL